MSSHKIFVVDDDAPFRHVINKILSAYDYQVSEGSGSLSVIQTIRQEKPDLILLDLYMPKAGGIEIIRTMRKLKIDIPVIVISGLLSKKDFQILLEHGIRHFLVKPIHLKTLLDAVKDVLHHE